MAASPSNPDRPLRSPRPSGDTPRHWRRAPAVEIFAARGLDEIAPTTGRGRSRVPRRAASSAGDPATASAESLVDDLERYRHELTGYCSRKLGSTLEADDAAQETILRAWRGMARFEGRSTVRTWLYRIATNVCRDMLRHPQRRAQPIGVRLTPAGESITAGMIPRRGAARPVRDLPARSGSDDPADVAESRESVRLAFAAALLHLPPRQVAVLILRDILRWSAADVADLLDTTVPSVNSALRRARATLADPLMIPSRSAPSDTVHRARLARYLDAFERSDVESLVGLFRQDSATRRRRALTG